MYEYKVIKVVVKNSEKEMNELAKQGCRVVAVSPDIARGMGLVITLEKEKEELQSLLVDKVFTKTTTLVVFFIFQRFSLVF